MAEYIFVIANRGLEVHERGYSAPHFEGMKACDEGEIGAGGEL